MTDNQPDKESLSCLPLDTVGKSARDAPKGLRHVKPSNQPDELTWDGAYEPASEETKQAMDEWLAGFKARQHTSRLSLWERFLCRIGWHRYKAIKDVKRLAKRIEAREASK